MAVGTANYWKQELRSQRRPSRDIPRLRIVQLHPRVTDGLSTSILCSFIQQLSVLGKDLEHRDGQQCQVEVTNHDANAALHCERVGGVRQNLDRRSLHAYPHQCYSVQRDDEPVHPSTCQPEWFGSLPHLQIQCHQPKWSRLGSHGPGQQLDYFHWLLFHLQGAVSGTDDSIRGPQERCFGPRTMLRPGFAALGVARLENGPS